jgi:hypothetical protein
VHASRAINQSLPMNYQLIPKELRLIAEKVEAQKRISEGDALILYGTNDVNALGMIANVVRERKNGNYATYIHGTSTTQTSASYPASSARLPPRNATRTHSNTQSTRSSRP